MRGDLPCDRCHKPCRDTGGRKGVTCANCGKKVYLCQGCANIYVACSDECSAEWRKRCKKMFDKPAPLREPLP